MLLELVSKITEIPFANKYTAAMYVNSGSIDVVVFELIPCLNEEFKYSHVQSFRDVNKNDDLLQDASAAVNAICNGRFEKVESK